MHNYKISIIIPTFNAECDLKRAINSLLKQTIGFENLEVILIDDCSTDNTQEIILDYAKKYDNIKYIFMETNSGSAGKPRNIGIKHSKADYIMFLDNDDEYVPEACEIFYKEIKKREVNLMVCSKTNDIFSPDDETFENSKETIFEEINVLENPDVLYSPITTYAGAMWCKIFKKEFLLKNNIKCLEKLPEDVYFMHQCYYLNPNVLFITNLSLYNHYFYRVKGTSITVSSNQIFLNKLFSMYDKLYELSQNFDNSDRFFSRYAHLFFNDLVFRIIMTDSTKKEKISLMKKYYSRACETNPKIDYMISSIWHYLVSKQLFNICFIYSQIIKCLSKLKKKL